jgi:hypothetical protein
MSASVGSVIVVFLVTFLFGLGIALLIGSGRS